MGRDCLPVDLDLGRAALRQAQRHLWPARHDAGRARRVYGGLGGSRGRAEYDHADPGPRPAGNRRRRHRAAGTIDHRRRRTAARARLLSGLYRLGLDYRRGGGSRARRLHLPTSALVADFLAERPALLRRGGHLQPATQAAAAACSRSPARSVWRCPDDGLGNGASSGADLGRRALPVAVVPDAVTGRRGGRHRRRLYLVGAARAGAVSAGCGTEQSDHACRHFRDVVHAGRQYRAHDLRAALLPAWSMVCPRAIPAWR